MRFMKALLLSFVFLVSCADTSSDPLEKPFDLEFDYLARKGRLPTPFTASDFEKYLQSPIPETEVIETVASPDLDKRNSHLVKEREITTINPQRFQREIYKLNQLLEKEGL